MKRYFLWSGLVMLICVLVIILAAGLYPKAVACDKFTESYYPSSAPEESLTHMVPDWYIHADCQGAQNDLRVAYYILAIGVAFVGAGFVIRRGEK